MHGEKQRKGVLFYALYSTRKYFLRAIWKRDLGFGPRVTRLLLPVSYIYVQK